MTEHRQGEEHGERVERQDAPRDARQDEPRGHDDGGREGGAHGDAPIEEGRADTEPPPQPGDAQPREAQAGGARAGHEHAGRDVLGSVADEAVKLIEALQERAARDLRNNMIRGTAAGLGQAFAGRKERDVWAEAVQEHHDEYICRACPVCRVIAAQRESGSDVTGHLVAAGSELFTAFRQAMEALQRSAGPRGPRRDRADVEHIDLG